MQEDRVSITMMETDNTELKKQLSKMQKQSTGKTAALEQRMSQLETKSFSMPEHKTSNIEHDLEVLQQKQRECDLVFYGVPEPPVESLPALREHVASLMDAESDDRPRPQIADVRRMGRSTGSINAKPRPVVVSFASKIDKSRGLKLKAVLRAKNIKLAPNLTPAQQTAKKRLQPAANVLYSEGKKPFWREAKLWYWQEGKSFPYLPPPPPRGAAQNGAGGGGSS